MCEHCNEIDVGIEVTSPYLGMFFFCCVFSEYGMAGEKLGNFKAKKYTKKIWHSNID